MKNKFLTLAALITLVAPLSTNLVSCKDDKEDPNPAKYNCAKEAKKNKDVQVIKFWHAFNNVNQTANQKVIDDFNTDQLESGNYERPICVTATTYGSYESLEKQITSSINSGQLPDLVSSYPDHVATYNESKVVVDMNKFQNDPEVAIGESDFNDILEAYRRESYNYTFNKTQLDSMKETGKGGLLSLPVNKSTEVMYYNKTFFDLYAHRTDEAIAAGAVQGGTTEALKAAKIKGGISAEQAANAKVFAVNITEELTVRIGNKTYVGFPWSGLKNKSDETDVIYLQHPGDIKINDTSTWFTWKDQIKTNGEIIKAMSLNYMDIITGKFYCDIILPSDEHGALIKERGSFSISWDSVSNLFISVANSYDKYSTINEKSNGKLQGQLLFNDSEVVKEYEYFRQLYKDGIFNIPLLMGDKKSKYGTPAFTSQAIMYSVGSTAGAALNSVGNFEVGITVPPIVNKDNPKIIQQGTNVTMIAKPQVVDATKDDTETAKKRAYNQQLATWTFIKYLTSYEGNLTFAKGTTYFPTRTSVLTDPSYLAVLEERKKGENPAEALAIEIGMQFATTGATFTDRPFKGSSTIRSEIEAEFTKIISSNDSVGSVISTFHNRAAGYASEF